MYLLGPEFVRLSTDGSVLHSGESSCAGLIVDARERWIKGYICKLPRVPPTIAELMALTHGLNICWQASLRKVEVCTDSVEAMDLVLRGCGRDYPFWQLVQDARELYTRDWEVVIRHIPREANIQADRMAREGHRMTTNALLFEDPPDFLTCTDPDRIPDFVTQSRYC